MASPTRILIVEDRPADAVLMERQIRGVLPAYTVERVDTEAAFRAALIVFAPDLILTDHSLPQFSARDVLRLAHDHSHTIPIIVVTGSLDEETAADYMRSGAADYIVKHHLERLGPAITRALTLNEAQAKQRRAQEELRASELRLRAVLDAALDAVVTIDTDGLILGWNAQAEAVFGWPAAEVLGRPMAETIIPPEYRKRHHEGLQRFLRTGEPRILNQRRRLEGLRRDGWLIPIEITVTRVRLQDRWLLSAFIRDLTEQLRAEKALKASEIRLQQVIGASAAVIYVIRVDGDRFIPTWVSENVTHLTGYHPEEALAAEWWVDRVHPEDRPAVQDELAQVMARGHFTAEYRFQTRDGTYRWFLDEARLQRYDETVELVGAWIDITARRTLEQQLSQARKMEAVGQLAGGIAHDFNNILTAITGNAGLLLNELPADDPGRDYAQEILAAATRAGNLTGQLLAFSRHQVLRPRVLDLRAVIVGMDSMLQRIIGEDIDLASRVTTERRQVRADPGQLEQVILNLVVNARDAMPAGGKITIEVAEASFDATYARTYPPALPGSYVMLAVSDTGHGMTPEVQARVFEPFFTTKGQGKGTGLGLATAYGIVKQSGGFVSVYSEVGKGTTFKVYLPLAGGPVSEPESPLPPAASGSETILLVEDDPGVRGVARGILVQYGYHILEATQPQEALELSARYDGPIHLLLSDVVMPGMSGRELADQLTRSRPETRVLLISGYPGVAMQHQGELPPDTAFLSKPFTADGLARQVRAVLDRGGS